MSDNLISASDVRRKALEAADLGTGVSLAPETVSRLMDVVDAAWAQSRYNRVALREALLRVPVIGAADDTGSVSRLIDHVCPECGYVTRRLANSVDQDPRCGAHRPHDEEHPERCWCRGLQRIKEGK